MRRRMEEERSSPSSWAPVICSSPLHSGGLSMDNPLEMFDEVGRSLKWFSLSRNAAAANHPNVNVASRDSCESETSSTISWNKISESRPPSDHGEEEPVTNEALSPHSQGGTSPERLALVRDQIFKPRINEIREESCTWSNDSQTSGMRDELCTWSRDDQIPKQDEVLDEPCMWNQDSQDSLKPKIDEMHENRCTWSKKHQNIKPKLDERHEDSCPWNKNDSTDGHFPNRDQPKQVACFYPHVLPQLCSDKDPVSDLVYSFFGNKQEARKFPEKVLSNKKLAEVENLEKKIDLLEAENVKAKKENQRLHKLLKVKEAELARCAQEKSSWEKQQFSSMEAILSEKEELVNSKNSLTWNLHGGTLQLQDLKREKRMLEKRLQAMSHLAYPLPNKAERKEISDLKAKLVDVHEEHLKKEARLRLTNVRLRKLMKELSGRLNEKQDEIKRYERLLLDWNARNEKPAKLETSPKDHANKHGYRTIKSVECLSSDSASVGCRITGALFYQRPDSRAKQQDGIINKECSSLISNCKDTSVRCDKKAATLTDKEQCLSGLGTEGSSLEATVVDEPHTSVSNARLEEPVERKEKNTNIKGSQRRSMVFTDGTREEEYQDGLACVYFPNGDIRNSLADGTTEYYYSEIDTWHTTKPNGVEIFYFPHNQIEEHWPDGHKRIIFPDGTSTLEY